METNFARMFYANTEYLSSKMGIPTEEIENTAGITWQGFRRNAHSGKALSYAKMRKIADLFGTSVDSMCSDDLVDKEGIGLLYERSDLLKARIKKVQRSHRKAWTRP